MPSFTIKVPNHDDGVDLGEYQADFLPRAGDRIMLWHPVVCAAKDQPLCGVVAAVDHEVFHRSHPYARNTNGDGYCDTTVWVTEEHAPPALYCDCTEAERERFKVVDGKCENCGHERT